jgi:dienelactone hydrolase
MTQASIYQPILDSVPLPAGSAIASERIAYADGDTALDGYLAWDDALDGPRPAVLIVHDWNGEDAHEQTRAQMLARLGYTAFAADVYGAGVRPTADADAAALVGRYYGDLALMRARVRAAYDVLRADARVDPERIAVMGYCFGGSASLEFARTGAELAGAVSFHGRLVTHEPADVDAIRAPLLVLTGAADPVVPDEAVVAFENELRQAPGLDWQVVSYSGAPHAFTVPTSESYRAKADARSWAALEVFLREVFG